jgi:hypothetical protein
MLHSLSKYIKLKCWSRLSSYLQCYIATHCSASTSSQCSNGAQSVQDTEATRLEDRDYVAHLVNLIAWLKTFVVLQTRLVRIAKLHEDTITMCTSEYATLSRSCDAKFSLVARSERALIPKPHPCSNPSPLRQHSNTVLQHCHRLESP